MSGSVITKSTTTMGLQQAAPVEALTDRDGYTSVAEVAYPQQVKVWDPGVAGVDVLLTLQRLRKVAPHEGGGHAAMTVAVLPLDRDEALNMVRAIQRALGIDPDALVRALLMVEDAETPDDLHEANDALYGAAVVHIGQQPADQRS